MRLLTIEADGYNPYQNLALESCLIEAGPDDAVILYLWQNQKTVVIGKNQNAWAECRVEELERDGGFLARRPSGGGAVFHDLGNLNFSFVAARDNYNVGCQLDVLIRAVEKLGVKAERSGRNDVTAGDKKFSGNAFSNRGERHCHHGTVMVDVDTTQLGKYLSPSPLKLAAKGVGSVKSRVCNLADLAPGITVLAVKAAMKQAFAEVYDGDFSVMTSADVDANRLRVLTELYESYAWTFGRRIPFAAERRHRFAWGEVLLQLQVESGTVKDALCFTDALNTGVTDGVSEALTDRRYTNEALSGGIMQLSLQNTAHSSELSEMARWLAQDID